MGKIKFASLLEVRTVNSISSRRTYCFIGSSSEELCTLDQFRCSSPYPFECFIRTEIGWSLEFIEADDITKAELLDFATKRGRVIVYLARNEYTVE